MGNRISEHWKITHTTTATLVKNETVGFTNKEKHVVSYYPSSLHEEVAELVVSYFSHQEQASSVLLTCSCARGKATRDSCLDMLVLLNPKCDEASHKILQQDWREFESKNSTIKKLSTIGKYSNLELDFWDGSFRPEERSWTSGPDPFELEIGNYLEYSVALSEKDRFLIQLRDDWLPYYEDELARKRLKETMGFFHNNLDHIPVYIRRGLHFQCFDRLYKAYKEFLQALFISRRVYPIAYDKWIKEQVSEILGLPELYKRLVHIFEVSQFEGLEIEEKASDLRQISEEYIEM